jgi:hypothetical protein
VFINRQSLICTSITAVYDGKEYGPVELHTDYEFVTLNVRDFGAYGDGEHDDTNAISLLYIKMSTMVLIIS